VGWLLRLFGFGKSDDEKSHEELLSELNSPSKNAEIQKEAYKAIQNNVNNQPNQPHPYEADIQNNCSKVDAKIAEFHTNQIKEPLADAESLLVMIESGLKVELQKSSATGIEHELSAVIAHHETEVVRIKKELAEATQAIKVFKGANGITTPANYPESKMNSLYIIGAIAIIEAICNSFFLHIQTSGKMALILALGIAVINVGGNVWLGNRYRNKNLNDTKKSSAGKRNFYYSLLLILALNSIIVWYRITVMGVDADSTFLLENLVLFAIGIGLGIAAFHKGYEMDDPYPGHGDLDRKLKELENQLGEIRSQYKDHSNKLIDLAINNLNGLDRRILGISSSFNSKLPEMAAQIARWELDRTSLEGAFKKLIEVFRLTYTSNSRENIAYPKALPKFPEATQLELIKKQVNSYVLRNRKLDAEVSKLIDQVNKAKSQLSTWTKSAEAQKLLNWPQ